MTRLPRTGTLLLALLVAFGASVGGFPRSGEQLASAQSAASPISCEPPSPTPSASGTPASVPVPLPRPLPDDPAKVTVAYVQATVFAPIFVAAGKGYFAEEGLDVTLEPVPGGSDMVALTASGDYDAGFGGAGPGFWNAIALGVGLTVIAPGHAEGIPVATPLVVARSQCESGAITRVADLKGKRVAVNAPGATEYWLSQALATDGLTLDDIEFQTLAFPDILAALDSGALDAAMLGEPFATRAEQEGIAVRLATDFAIQGIQPTVVFANQDFVDDDPDAATGLVKAYLRACRDLSGTGFAKPENLAIIEEYTGVPAALVGQGVPPVYAVDGTINLDGLRTLQTFFRERGQLEYADDLDPAALVDTRFVDAALAELGPYQFSS